MSDLSNRLPCGCRDHDMRTCWLARAVWTTTPGLARPSIPPPWERGKDWPKPA